MTPEQILYKEVKIFSNSCGIAITSITTLPIEDALIKAMNEYSKQCFEAARNTTTDSYETGDYEFETFEDYIKSFSIPNKTH